MGNDPLWRGTHPQEVLGETEVPWPRTGFYPAKHFGQITAQQQLSVENLAYLADLQFTRFAEPVLCVSATRNETRQICRAVAARFEPLEPLPESLQRIAELVETRFPFLRSLRDAVLKGVAYHNAALPHILRQAIEDAIMLRSLRVVAATTTLAEGVDLPFRVTIVANWLFYDGEAGRPMSALLFRNIAGRCGRPGMFTEGDVVVYDNPVGDAEMTHPARRPALQRDIFFVPTPPHLATSVTKNAGQGPAAFAVLGSQLLGAIQENPAVTDLGEEFFSNTFAARLGIDTRRAVRDMVGRAVDSLVNEEPRLAEAASPLRLTALGAGASRTGLSPATARKPTAFLGELDADAGLETVASLLLRTFADAPEQTNANLTKTVHNARSKFSVKPDDFEAVVGGWLVGTPLDRLFQALPWVTRSRRRPALGEWLAGLPEHSTWDVEFDKFTDFVYQVFEGFLPWLLRSCGVLSEIAHPTLEERQWSLWARMVEGGVNHQWAVWALEDGAPPDREALVAVSQALDRLGVSFVQAILEGPGVVRPAFEHALAQVGGRESPIGRAVLALQAWYSQKHGT